jgi:hypothetical protein
VFNTPGANANAVKELVLCALLVASRDIIGGANWVQEKAWEPGCDLETAVEKGCRIRLSRDPLLPDHIDGILFEESGFAVVVVHPKECPEGVRRVDLRRFVRIREARDCKRALLYAERMKRAMLGGAEEALEEAKEHHFALEEIYSLAMDFASPISPAFDAE